MKIDNNRIQKFKIFNNLNDDEIKLFLDKMQLQSYKENDVIMQEDDEGHQDAEPEGLGAHVLHELALGDHDRLTHRSSLLRRE